METIESMLGECCTSLLQHSPIGAEVFRDAEGDWQVADLRLVWHNARAGEIFGQRDMVGRRPYATTPGQYNILQGLMDGFRNGLGMPLKPLRYQIERPNGEDLVLDMTMVPMDSGKLLVWLEDRTGTTFRERMEDAGLRMRQTPWLKLSLRERAVATLIVRQRTTTQIAEVLGVSERTIENHRLAIRKKFNMVGEGSDLYEYLMNHD